MQGKLASGLSAVLAGGLLVTVVTAGSSNGSAAQHVRLRTASAAGVLADLDNCPTLAEGYHGGCVDQLQSELNSGENAGLTVDGTFGPATQQAVIRFQQANGIPADGIVGPETKAALDSTASVATPQPAGTPNYPISFDPVRAASWATANASTDADISSDPCTEFVSRALSAAGMPDDGAWYSDSDSVERYINSGNLSRPWWNATSFEQLMAARNWIKVIPLDLTDPASAGQQISSDGAIANTGDLIYYEWNGVPSPDHVHMAMITGFNGRIALVTQQSGSGQYGINTQWDLSYLSGGIPLTQKYGASARAFLLHWQ
jgi:hypothetical protein